jgi:hypothetical protein
MTLFCISSNLLRTRNDTETTRMWATATNQVLKLYTIQNNVRVPPYTGGRSNLPLLLQAELFKAVQNDEVRSPALVLAEIALLVALSSEDSAISNVAAKGLRCIAFLEGLPGGPPVVDDDLLSKRHLVYEQLGDPRVVIVGM